VTTLAQLECQEVAGRVGESDLVAVAVGVPETELGAGIGFLASTDDPRAGRPARQLDVQLGHLAGMAGLAVVSHGANPALGRHGPNGGTEGVVHPGVHGELDVAGDQAVDESGHRPGAVGAHDDAMGHVGHLVTGAVASAPSHGQRGDRAIHRRQLVRTGVGHRVARAQDPGQGLAGGIGETEHRVKAVPALVVRRRRLLVGRVDLDQGGVDAEDGLVGSTEAVSHLGPGRASGSTQGVEPVTSPISRTARHTVAGDANVPNRWAGRAAPPDRRRTRLRRSSITDSLGQ